jgi:microcompartment protein CcmL/EutN
MFVNRRKDMSKLSLGIIETVGLAAAIEAADTCVKSANVKLVGYELSKGDGMTVVKIEGNVGAVKAAISAAEMSASWVSAVISCRVIARPSDQLGMMIENSETVGLEKCQEEEINILSDEIEVDKIVTKVNEDTELTKSDESIDNKELVSEDKEVKFTCNICKDPECTRKKGDLRRECIHY